jgi:hypothetical protein
LGLFDRRLRPMRAASDKVGLILSWMLLTFALAGCGQPEVQPFALAATPWQTGEVTVYEVTDINGAAAGTARYTLTTGAGENNPESWTIQREIVAQGTTEVVVVVVSQNGLRPQSSLLTRINKDGQQIVQSTYSSSGVDTVLTSVQNITTYNHFNIPSDALDLDTVLQVVRALPLAEGYATRLNSFGTTTGRVERVTVEVIQQEQVTTQAGDFDTWQVALETPTTKTTAWIGRDDARPLVKYIDGRNGGTFVLREYTAGK